MKKGFSIVFSILLFGSFAEASPLLQVPQNSMQKSPKLQPVRPPEDMLRELDKDDFTLSKKRSKDIVLEKFYSFVVKLRRFMHK